MNNLIFYIKKCIEYPCWDYLFWNSLPLYTKKKISPMNPNPIYKLYYYVFRRRHIIETSVFLTNKGEINLYTEILFHLRLKNKYYGIKGFHRKLLAFAFYYILQTR